MKGLWRGVQLLLHRYVPISEKLAIAYSMLPLVLRLICEEKPRRESEMRVHIEKGVNTLCDITGFSTCSELRNAVAETKGSLCTSIYTIADRASKLTPIQQSEYMAILLTSLVATLSKPEDYEAMILELWEREATAHGASRESGGS